MLKSIKKSVKYFIMFAGTLLLVPTFFYLLLRTPQVQTFIVKRITSHFSDQIKSTISIGKIEFSFFNKLLISDLLIKDRNNDTLIYSSRISAGLRRLDFRNRIFRLGQVDLSDVSVGLISDSTGLMNLTWYLDMLGKSADTAGPQAKAAEVTIDRISVSDGRFLLLRKSAPATATPIDFNNLHASDIACSINNFKIRNDSTVLDVRKLSFRESGGFVVRGFSSDIVIARNSYRFGKIFLNCDSSIINADYVKLTGDSAGSFGKFTDEVRLDVLLEKSLISASDLRYFVPFLKGSDEQVVISGRVFGTVAELKGRDIKVSLRNHSSLDCDFDFSGLPDINNTFIHVAVNNLVTNARDFEKPVLPGSRKLELPDIAGKMGDISFSGSFTGFISDFVAYGRFRTELGSLHTDISLRPFGKNMFRIKGLVAGSNIDLGTVTGNSELLGKISMEANIDGTASSNRTIEGSLTGNIDSLELNKYTYRNVALKGDFTEKTWDGSIKISEKNIRMDLLGMFDFRNELPEFDFTLNMANANLHRLNFEKSDTSSRLSMLLTANFRGNSIDNLFGEIKMLNSTIIRHNSKLELYDFSLKAFNDSNKPAISLRTDFVDAELRGYYNFGAVGNVVKSAMATLIPAEFTPPPPVKGEARNDFRITANFKNTDKINDFFNTGVHFSPGTSINGIFTQDSLIFISAKSSSLGFMNNVFRDLSVDGTYSGDRFDLGVKSSSLSVLGQSEIKDFRIIFGVRPDSFNFRLNWDNKDKVLNTGAFRAAGQFARNPKATKGAILTVNIDSSEVFTRNNLWRISQSSVIMDTSSVTVNKFTLVNGNNMYAINGTVSENPADTLRVMFNGIDISPLSRGNMKPGNTSVTQIPFDPKGIVSGNIVLSNVLRNPVIQSNLAVKGFSILGADYGDISTVSAWNKGNRVVDITARNNLKGIRNLDVTGTYNPESGKVDLDILTSRLPVEALNPLLSFFASGITGTVTGRVNLSGQLNALVMKGAMMAENTSMKINYLQTKYRINDSIYFDKTGIRFRNLKVTDEKGNSGTLTGAIHHKSFRDYTADLTVNMEKNPVLVLNTQAKDNQLFYGTAYATGVCSIKSDQNTLAFEISAKVGKGTKFFIPLNMGLTVTEHPFVTFVNSDSVRKEESRKTIVAQVQTTSSKLELTFDLDVTPDAEVQLLIDPIAGDVIKGKGEGKLNISLNKKGEFKVYGDYTISQGDYLFTLKSLLNKRFEVESGGKITFNGDMSKAEIDLKASYKNLKTSLFPILQDERYNQRISVEPQLNLSGNLFSPVVGFNIILPNADEETKTYLQNAIATPDELSKQFLYLLVMNSFYADPNFRSSSGAGASGTSAMASTTTEMLSNQLSNWLSKISKDFNLGFVYRPSNNEINSQELQVALSTQLLNDKVSINGNFDVRGANSVYGEPITGDFDIEYKITDKIRFKVFNRYNNPYTGRQFPYTQGLGVFYKEDFNKFSDLLKKKESSPMKKEEEVKPKKK